MSTERPSWLSPGTMVAFVRDCNYGVYAYESKRGRAPTWRTFRTVVADERAMILGYVVGFNSHWDDTALLLMSCGIVVKIHKLNSSAGADWSLLKPM